MPLMIIVAAMRMNGYSFVVATIAVGVVAVVVNRNIFDFIVNFLFGKQQDHYAFKYCC